ncbi:2OG-Fe(II) oxygenase [Pseudoalteromonas luteoviolacea]|uniref:2OG-Fe(II) oxygenase n=1 Tax=Pseudoalteromonas luteoviolacea TaxID=43657 RepID=UPI001F3346F4|nr:2OG-Fe(II) oxygenase [Pseudoalteromonas luteoviolacea]MCF6441823.1 2OG-Fe(II) oxygenase [Pseudoalteromonas luteoviolacea]
MQLCRLDENIFTVHAFLSERECRELIVQSELSGYRNADVQVGVSRSYLSNIRNNHRVNWISESLAEQLWKKLSHMTMPNIEGKRAIGLSPHFRFYRYTPGQKFNMHKDGRQSVSGGVTMMTLLVYLNDDYEGGCTQFRQSNLEVHAAIGKSLIFEHHLWHKGNEVLTGVKYVLRTDIVYQ